MAKIKCSGAELGWEIVTLVLLAGVVAAVLLMVAGCETARVLPAGVDCSQRPQAGDWRPEAEWQAACGLGR